MTKSAVPCPEDRPSAATSTVERLRALVLHRHHPRPPLLNLNEIQDAQLTRGERIADRFASIMGSWPFIIIQSILLFLWVTANIIAWVHHWDPYPFILLNLTLSFQAAYAAPIIMMSQNRQSDKDRAAAQHDYEVNVRAEAGIHAVMDHLQAQHEAILAILERLESHEMKVEQLVEEVRDHVSARDAAGGPA
jgi:uncharacterized membrane protein